MKSKIDHRRAKIGDISRLVEIENQCFDYDMLDAKKFRYFIKKGHTDLVVLLHKNKIAGYGLLFYKKASSLCRLYSIAISPDFRGLGLGEALLSILELYAKESDCSYIRLEVKKSNDPAIGLYKKLGYVPFNIKEDYYEDHEDAVCFEKKIQTMDHTGYKKLKVPFYKQTTDFTCGSSALMMAMKALKPKYQMTRNEELEIWREATTIFMTSGHGGCGPRGLALAAKKRGFKPQVYLNSLEHLFIDSVRDQDKKNVIKMVQDDFDKKIKKEKIPFHLKDINLNTVEKILENGGVILMLISAYRLTQQKVPHWIVITGKNDNFVFFNDPYVEEEGSVIENTNIPVRKDEFKKLSKFGFKQLKAIVAIFK